MFDHHHIKFIKNVTALILKSIDKAIKKSQINYFDMFFFLLFSGIVALIILNFYVEMEIILPLPT